MNTNKLTGDRMGATGILNSLRGMFNMSNPSTWSAIGMMENQSEIDRINVAQRLYDFYNGDSSEIVKHLEKAMGKTFSGDDIAEFQMLYLPIARRIIDKLCLVYKSGVRRFLENDGSTDKLQELYEASDITRKQRQWYRYGRLFHTVLVQPVVRQINGVDVLNYDILTPNKVTVKEREDNFLLPSEVVYQIAARDHSGQPTLHSVYWSDEEHYVLNEKGEKIIDEGNVGSINPYKRLPFAVLRMRETEDFWGEGETVLANVEEKIDILLVQWMDLMIMQAHGQPVFTNTKLEGDVKTGPRHPMLLTPYNPDQPANFAFVSPQAKMAEVQAGIDWFIEKTAVMYGLSKTSEEGQVASGFAKMLDNWDLMEQREEDVEILKSFESDLYDITRTVVNYEKPNGLTLPEKEVFSIEFEEYNYPIDPAVELQLKKDKMELGLWTPVDDLMARDKTLTIEDAKQILQDNLAIRNELKDQFGLFVNDVDGKEVSPQTDALGKIPLALQQIALARERAMTAGDTGLAARLGKQMEDLSNQLEGLSE